ncbi:uncharacterized protein LOC120090597 [Benincasa hispida]|uniref:uncharacterized protein LOC120090597 n=1 Tax=Benincasa hispida TaxID=102211 RepID=UPI00190043F2|nr:uncharacterized protein LOC120090597 [Benincasa hispida]
MGQIASELKSRPQGALPSSTELPGNPRGSGMYTALKIDKNGHVKLCFMAIGASIEGWRYCKPIISVDASTLNGNDNIFPLEFSIVDFENDVSWECVLSVFNNVEYYVCIQHILRNLKKLFKDPFIDQFEKWSRTYSQRIRYEMMTTNPSECVNSVLKENRNLPVASLLDAIRGLLKNWFHDRRKASFSMTTILTPWAENILCSQHEQSRSFMVHPIDNVQYSVMDGDKQFLVKLNLGSCSCRVWDFEEISCSHALVILELLNMDIYSYVSNYYYSSTLSWTYLGCVRPIGVHSNWRVLDDDIRALPPIFKRSAGGPKKQRIPSKSEAKSSSLRCSRCHSKGHNSRTCKLRLISQ